MKEESRDGSRSRQTGIYFKWSITYRMRKRKWKQGQADELFDENVENSFNVC